MIKAEIIGFIGQDCRVTEFNGKNAISFSVAHAEKFKDAKGVQHEKTTWVNCTQWSDRTAIAPYLKKGTLIYVDGIPEVGTYQDKSGKWQAEFKLRVSSIQLLGGSKEGSNQPQQQQSNAQQPTQGSNIGGYSDITEPVDSLPF